MKYLLTSIVFMDRSYVFFFFDDDDYYVLLFPLRTSPYWHPLIDTDNFFVCVCGNCFEWKLYFFQKKVSVCIWVAISDTHTLS